MPYGSEWHLLRFMGRRRHQFNEFVGRVVGGEVTGWLDHPSAASGKPYFGGPRLDREWAGLDFLPPEYPARQAWPDFWPQTGEVPNWDAVGRVRVGVADDLLLVEAKAHLGELRSACKAAEHGGLPSIRQALDLGKQGCGVPSAANWLRPYYQFCNRLTVLDFLMRHGVGARLLFVYFCGDTNPGGRCPQNTAGWEPALQAMYQHVGLMGRSPLKERVHNLFVSVAEHDS